MTADEKAESKEVADMERKARGERLRKMLEIKLRELSAAGVPAVDVEFFRIGFMEAIDMVKTSRDVQELMGNILQSVHTMISGVD